MAPWVERNRLKNEKKKKLISKLSDKELSKQGKKTRQSITYHKPKTDAEKEKKRKLEKKDSRYYEEWKRRDIKKKKK